MPMIATGTGCVGSAEFKCLPLIERRLGWVVCGTGPPPACSCDQTQASGLLRRSGIGPNTTPLGFSDVLHAGMSCPSKKPLFSGVCLALHGCNCEHLIFWWM